MKILLAIDGSAPALDATRYVVQLQAEGLDLQVVLVNVQEPTHVYEFLLAPDADVLADASRDASEHALRPAEGLLQAAGVPYETELVLGAPTHVLVDAAERHGCDAIVMGAYGVGELVRGAPGTVAQAVLHNATVPVTLVRPPPPPEAESDERDDPLP